MTNHHGTTGERIALHVRLPEQLHRELVALAKDNHRSLNGQLIALLELAMEQAEERGS